MDRKPFLKAAAIGLVVSAALAFVAQASAFVYWGDFQNDRIGRAGNDGSEIDPNFIQTAGRPGAVAVDVSHIYWASPDTEAIGRANIDGSGVDNSFVTGIKELNGIAVNATSIFWSTTAGPIGRASINGSGVNKSFITKAQEPCGLAVDSGHIWWADDRLTESTIGRASLDGSFVQPNFAEIGTAFPCGLVVNSANVYWSDLGFFAGGSSIGRVDTATGKAVDQSFIAGGSAPCGIALDTSSHLYWANAGTDTIARANSDGTAVDQNFIATGGNQICGVAVDNLTPPPPPPIGGAGTSGGGGGGGSGGGSVDTTPPTTKINRGPGKKLAQGKAKFSFSSSEPSSTFTCKLDKSKPKPCASPKSYKALKPGRHTFKVWATDAAGNRAATPATRRFQVPA